MQTINLAVPPSESHSLLVYALYGAGKTHFGGDALATEKANGRCVYVNVAGQDGWAPLSGMDLSGVEGVQFDNYDDCEAFIRQNRTKKPHLVVYDGALDLSLLSMAKSIGTTSRLPKAGDSKSNEWSDVHFRAAHLFKRLREVSRYAIFTAPADRYIIQETGVTHIAPTMPGRQTREAIGWFDFVGYLRAQNRGNGTVDRRLVVTRQEDGTKDSPSILTRQRLTHEIRNDVVIPDGPGGWAAWMAAVKAAEGETHGGG